MGPLTAWVTALTLYMLSAPMVEPKNGDPFEKGILLCQQKKYAECIENLEKALYRTPEGSNILWNLGLASAASGRHERALTYWKRYRQLKEEDWRVIPKLIQTYQALGRIQERNEWLATLFHLRQATTDEEWKKKEFFCREQFRLEGKLIMVFQYYKPKGNEKLFYFFSVVGDDGKEQFYISLGSYEENNNLAREMGVLKDDERVFHLDGYYKGGEHKLFRMIQRRKTPGYDEIRPIAVAILEWEIPRVSSQLKQ